MHRLDLLGSGVLLAWLALALLFRAAAARDAHAPAAAYRRLLTALLLASACLCLPWLRERLPRLLTAFSPITLDVQVLASTAPGPARFGSTRAFVFSPFAILALVWAGACAVGALRWAGARLRLSRLLARAVAAPAVLQVVVLQLARSSGAQEPRLLLSCDAVSPFSFGWLRPVVVLPHDLLEALSPEQLRLVLLHELSHLRRRDPLTHGLARLCAALFPLHPSLPGLMRELSFAREAAVDAEVATSDRHGYASLLVQLASRARYGVGPEPVAMDDTALARRIALLTRPSAPARSAAALALAAAAIAALGLFTPRVFARPSLALAAAAPGPGAAFFAPHEGPMAAHEAEIDECYALARESDPELSLETLAELDVDPQQDFQVVAADIPTPSSPTFQSCLEEKALTWRFPPPPGAPPPPADMPEDARAMVRLHLQRRP